MFKVSGEHRDGDEGEGAIGRSTRELGKVRAEMARRRVQSTEAAALDVPELLRDLLRWEGVVEQARGELARLIVERDRWRIAHDKLRERVDRHSIRPRMSEREASPGLQRPPVSEGEDDFRTIDAQLAKLNESMLAHRLPSQPAPPSQEFAAIDAELSKLNESMQRALSAKSNV